jgi:hypothetical protein
MSETDELARRMAASATGTDTRSPLADKRLIDALVRAISQGHAPVIQQYVPRELAKALVPLQVAIEAIEAELAQMRGRR